MKKTTAARAALPLAALATQAALPRTAFGHDGHGLDGAHWHASDTFGFVLAGVLAAFALWWSRRK